MRSDCLFIVMWWLSLVFDYCVFLQRFLCGCLAVMCCVGDLICFGWRFGGCFVGMLQ